MSVCEEGVPLQAKIREVGIINNTKHSVGTPLGGVERKLPCYPEIFGASMAVQLWRFLLVAAHVTEDMDDDTFVRFARVPFV